MEHIQTLRKLIDKYQEYNVPLHLTSVDYNKAFDSTELRSIFKDMDYAKLHSSDDTYQLPKLN